jgi:TonB family protein
MASVVPPPPKTEIHLLTEWGDPSDKPRQRRAGVISVLLHAAAVLALMLAPATVFEGPRNAFSEVVTPLIAPYSELTQKSGKLSTPTKEYSGSNLGARPRMQAPPVRTFQPAPLPVPSTPVIPEPPKLDQGRSALELPRLAQVSPQIQAAEQPPKNPFENPTAIPMPEPGSGRRLPKASDVIRGGGLSTTDNGGVGEFNSLSLPSNTGMEPQLLSDPMGVDFRPYLNAILATVRRNWMVVWPEAARMGRTGKVALQFSIDKSGVVPKLVIATSSGVSSLDRAAVAAISQSVPFPPFPKNFRGDQIKLQLNFAYNAGRQ